MNLDTAQRSAIARATSTPFSIINGGAGTGKTTIIKAIATALEASGKTVQLSAFAGKAAARLREACEHPASTIHRMLGYDGRRFVLETLEGVTVIVDEASMIDSALLAEIIRRRPARLILVGDEAQLPPVGRGQPFHDLIRFRPGLVANLRTCYRATEAVFKAATAIRGGGRPPLRETSESEKWEIRQTGDPERTQAAILKWVKSGAFDFENDVILVARNGETPDEPCTVRGLNKAIIAAISPRDDKVKFRVGDRVINTKNLPALDMWNGSTGTIHAIDQDGGIWIKTDVPVITPYGGMGDKVLFPKDKRVHLELAYALTVHKAQGSQYRRVLIACFRRDGFGLLDRALLYTAVTRTREACCVVGEESAVWAAIDRVEEKRTVIQQIAGDAA